MEGWGAQGWGDFGRRDARGHTGMGFSTPGEGWTTVMALESLRLSGASSQVSHSEILRGQGNPLLPTTGHTIHHISTFQSL